MKTVVKVKRSPTDPISLKEEIKKLEDDPRRDLNIIAFYLTEKKPDLRTYGQLQAAIKRHIRPAQQLIAFWDDQLVKGFKVAASKTPDWTLETVVKMLTK